MIAVIEGRIIEQDTDSVIIMVNGIGLRVSVPVQTAVKLQAGKEVSLFTHLIVREDALSLYGFEAKEERDLFLLLLGVNGVGPRLALSVLSALNADTIRSAIVNEQVEIFSRVPGVGKKTAQKILLYLSDKIKKEEGLKPLITISEADQDVLSALTTLGYSIVESQAAIQSIPKDAAQDVESRLRAALQNLSR
jgi:Holliday junction DNA helicase RuvA